MKNIFIILALLGSLAEAQSPCSSSFGEQAEVYGQLFKAVEKGDLSLVQSLFKKELNPNVQNSEGDTLLHISARYNHYRITRFLVSKGAGLYIKNNNGNVPLHEVGFFYDSPVAKKLLEELSSSQLSPQNRAQLTQQYMEVRVGEASTAAFLVIEKRADPNIQNNDGDTPLHIAVRNGGHATVNYFVHYRADPNIQNNKGETPYHVATKGKNKMIEALLIGRGADIRIKDPSSKSL